MAVKTLQRWWRITPLGEKTQIFHVDACCLAGTETTRLTHDCPGNRVSDRSSVDIKSLDLEHALMSNHKDLDSFEYCSSNCSALFGTCHLSGHESLMWIRYELDHIDWYGGITAAPCHTFLFPGIANSRVKMNLHNLPLMFAMKSWLKKLLVNQVLKVSLIEKISVSSWSHFLIVYFQYVPILFFWVASCCKFLDSKVLTSMDCTEVMSYLTSLEHRLDGCCRCQMHISHHIFQIISPYKKCDVDNAAWFRRYIDVRGHLSQSLQSCANISEHMFSRDLFIGCEVECAAP